jgi:hypothetical protein
LTFSVHRAFRLGWVLSLPALLVSCAQTPPTPPQYARCKARMDEFAAQIQKGYVALGYRFSTRITLDAQMLDHRGVAQPATVMGDALAGGFIRMRPSSVCQSDMAARVVLAHEMAHVALRHNGARQGVVLKIGDTRQPVQELEADQLAARVLEKIDARAADYMYCRLNLCPQALVGTAVKMDEAPLVPAVVK